jgi:hypothetical protein
VRRVNTAIVVIAVLAMIGAGTGIGLAATAGAATRATARTSAATAAKPPTYVVVDCNSGPEVKPANYFQTCADGYLGVQDMHWTSWTAELASGYGTMYYNDCVPYCVKGHFHYFHALLVFWGSASVKGHPADRRYTWLTLIFTGKRPPVYNLKNGKLAASYPVTQTWAVMPV